MPDRVVDASVLGALFFREQRADEAEAYVAGHQLFEPTLLAYEMASVALKKSKLTPTHADRIRDALTRALSADVRWADVDQPAVLDLALGTGLSSYDATYLYVAQTLQLPLVTFDRRLQVAADELGIASI
jgi:predicted nucleic acid-binding protein